MEKQFLYQLLMREERPEQAMTTFRECLKRLNSRENYERFLHSGFPVLLRDEARSVEKTATLAERIFRLA